MSLAALMVVAAQVAVFGTQRQADEGAAAHIFQILIAAQVPLVIYRAIRWLPRNPSSEIRVLSLQISALLAACAPVAILGL
jgi:hypothetical protein